MNLQRDPVTGRVIAEAEQQQDKAKWRIDTHAFSANLNRAAPDVLCRELYHFLDQQSCGKLGERPLVPLCDHAPDSYVTDHALLTSALVYCLAAEHTPAQPLIDTLRLAALGHEFPEAAQAQLQRCVDAETAAFLTQAWTMLRRQTAALTSALQSADSLSAFTDVVDMGDAGLTLLWYAHLAASQPLFNHKLTLPDQTVFAVIQNRPDFDRHPLRLCEPRIGLVYGGATKIKEYVFESAKLPEIRGASTLLDRLNQEQARALFAAAPECVIYANGGDLLALAPAPQAQSLADQIEACYLAETLTAQAVAVAATYQLLEVQYGLQPQRFWADAYVQQLPQASAEQAALWRSYYGAPTHKQWCGWSDEMLFHRRKSFGELATQLALKRLWRREGNDGLWQQHDPLTARLLPYFETLPHGQYCSSCDRRIAVVHVPELNDVLCDPCRRKRWMGWRMRRGERQRADALCEGTTWRPDADAGSKFLPWFEQFQYHFDQPADGADLAELQDLKARYLVGCTSADWEELAITVPLTLGEIGQAAHPRRFIGLVYADGNNVGAIIERIRTASFYRQFATRLFEATKAAVFAALANHLQPITVQDDKGKDRKIHPFEIVSIGGDDLFLLVPADKALPIAQHIAAHIETCFSNGDPAYGKQAQLVQRYRPHAFQVNGQPCVSLSAGVVLAAETTPIFFLKELVDDLLDSAKKAAKQRKQTGYAGSTIDFMALKAVSMVTSSVEEFREAALTESKWTTVEPADARQTPRSAQDVLHLTARPYTLHEIDGLLRTVASLKALHFPRSQLYQLRELLPQGRFVSSLNYLYFSSRLRAVDSTLLRHVLDRAWCPTVTEPVPWRRQWQTKAACEPVKESHTQHWETVLADVIELYDFVPAAERTAVLAEMKLALEEMNHG